MLFRKKFNKVGNSPHFKMMPTVLLSLLLIITVAFLTGMAAIFPKREVVIYDEGIKVCSLHTSSSDYGKIVNENLSAKPFKEKDRYDVNEKGNLCEINVKRSFNLNVNILGETKNVEVSQGTKVLDVLKELKVEPKEDLYITPDLETVVEPNTKIEVIKVERKKQEVREVELPFETKYVLDVSLKKEEKKLGQKGVKGKKEVFVEEIYSNGKLIKKEPKEIIITPAVDEIFHVGDLNKKNEKPKERANKNTQPINNNAAVQINEASNTITIDGKTYEYTRKLIGPITAYPATLGNTSRMGPARRGVVAANPKVFPYGTKLFIPGYGICVVGDLCGAACKGKVLVDVCFSTEKECRAWGRKTLPVYVLK